MKLNTKIAIALLSTLTAVAGITATTMRPDSVAPKHDANAQDNDAITLYGVIEDNTSWSTTREVGVYSFCSDGSDDFKKEGLIQSDRLVTGGGAFANGYFYYINGSQNSNIDRIQNTFNKVDADTWQVVNTSGHTSPTLTDALCMAYDYTTETMYAYSSNYESRDSQNPHYALRTVNLETGEFTNVGNIDQNYFIIALACDANGQLYGIENRDNERSARLIKINKTNATTSVVGELGHIAGSEYAGAAFDHRTGRLYLATKTFTVNPDFSRNYSACLFEVDPATGKAQIVKTFANDEMISALFIKDTHPFAPEAAANLKFNYTDDYHGRLSYTIPSRRYNRSSLSGNIKTELFLNGTLVETLENNSVGSSVNSKILTLEKNKLNKARVYCYDADGRKSVVAELSIWGGKDVPAKPTDVKISVTENSETATITWSAPTESKYGGVCDLENITYKVVRRPDMTTVATGLKETTFTDTPDRVMYLTQYEVYAEVGGNTGDAAYSPAELVGQPRPIRYRESFDESKNFYTYTSISGAATEIGNKWIFDPEYFAALYWLDYTHSTGADSWFITPTLKLEKDKVYRMSFDTQGFASETTYQTLILAVGDGNKAENMKREFMRVEGEVDKSYTTYHGFFVADQGDNRVGFHLLNNGRDHCEIDNVIIDYYGPSTIPAAPEVVKRATVDGNAVITVKAPDTDTRGRKITSLSKVSLYRVGSSRAIATINNPTPGEEVDLTDTKAVFGNNNYYITATNNDGEGLETNVSVNTKAPKPVAAVNVVAKSTNNNRDVEISWSYPEGNPAADGTTLDASELSYDLYRADGLNRIVVAKGITSTSYTHTAVMDLFKEEQQKRITYCVVASTSGGSATEATADVTVGDAYDLPVAEYEFYNTNTRPWVSFPSTAWQPRGQGYLPNNDIVRPYKGYTLMSTDEEGGNWMSPRFNLTSLHNPQLSFMLYGAKNAGNNFIEIGIVRDIDGVEQLAEMIPATYSCKGNNDWQKVTVDLSAYGNYERASIVFVSALYNEYPAIIDDIQITGEKLTYDPRITHLDGPANCVRGRENTYVANFRNNGIRTAENVKVSFLVDDVEIDSENISIPAEGTTSTEFVYTPDLNGADETPATIKVKFSTNADGKDYTGEVVKKITLVVPNVPYVNDLRGEFDEQAQAVNLYWSEAKQYPRAFPIKETFDNYDDFIIDGIGNWKVVDKDGAATIGGIQSTTNAYTWTNSGAPQAFIVFNPITIGLSDLCTAYSGDKCLVSFVCAAANNDDWLISPQLLGAEQTISFYTRVVNSAYNNETYEIWYSTSGDDIDDFVLLDNKAVRVSSDSWVRKTHTLPDGARYFAIRCTSKDQFGLMLDDIEYVAAQQSVNLNGYNVYRDGQLIEECIGETEYTNTGVSINDEYEYQVSAVYDDGESILSNTVVIKTTGIDNIDGTEVKVACGNGYIVVDGAENVPLTIFNISGQMLYRINGSGHDAFNVGEGVYLLTIGNKSYKLFVR